MKMHVIGYWIATALIALSMASGGVLDVMHGEQVMVGMRQLGYPDYFATILGVFKIAGAIVILLPGLPRLKEWAYAGIAFDLIGASASHAFSGDPVAKIATPLVLLVIMFASWWLRPGGRKLAGPVI